MAHLFFSIVVVSLNPGDKLFSTLQSILDQDYGNFEIIIKDGGSTDGSVQRLFGEGTERKIPAPALRQRRRTTIFRLRRRRKRTKRLKTEETIGTVTA